VCSDQSCVPKSITLQTTLRVGQGEHDPAAAPVIAQAQAALPQSLAAQATLTPDGKGIALHLPFAGDHLMAFATQADGGALSTPQITSTQDGTDLTLSPTPKLVSGQLSLVVTQTDAQGAPVKAWQITATPMPSPAHKAFPPGLLAFGAAVIGGLLLNLMPCVFPILSLKAMALVRAGADEAQAKIEALGYLVGACATMMALGAMVLTLRASGEAVGWAFQLQNPAVMAVLVLLVTGIALNMAGLFELPGLSVSMQRRSGFAGGCGTGALAAFIATPCTGPFMAGALGAALVLPTVQAMAVFAGLGFGLSLPFLVIGWWKPARRLMPAPGNWMVSLRHLLALPMFATAAGLVWLVGQQGGVNAMAVALAASVLLGVGLWWMGLRQRAGHAMWPALPVCGLAIGLAVIGAGMMPATATQTTSTARSERYSPQRLAQLQSEHRPVLLYATAQWCLTCKVNEATSLSTMSVQTAMRQHGAVLMEADWTRPTPEVTQLLTAHGRAGVPLYLWYGRNGSLQTLPQILTPAMIADLVSRG